VAPKGSRHKRPLTKQIGDRHDREAELGKPSDSASHHAVVAGARQQPMTEHE
jgi:hypothetical protein